jgi:hypothetical protein
MLNSLATAACGYILKHILFLVKQQNFQVYLLCSIMLLSLTKKAAKHTHVSALVLCHREISSPEKQVCHSKLSLPHSLRVVSMQPTSLT